MSVDSMFLRAADRQDIPRHPRWGGPMIVPEGGGKPVYYARVSSFAKVLDDASGLNNWYGRQTALGLARRPDLMHRVATTKADDKNGLNEIVAQAMAAAESSAAANLGTALHSATEHVDLGGDLDVLPADLRADVAAYQSATANLQMLAMEQFIVIDDMKLGGTFDRLVRLPDGRVIVADLKTGKHAATYGQQTAAIQMACYAHGHLYTVDGSRHPMTGVDTSVGLLIHLPVGTGTCSLHLLDLTLAWQMAQVSSAVKTWRKAKVATEVTF